eukprot:TRINITY_DN30774_c0_g1_i1.p1 TRINITY_DN30774_c0_g1~~TRINITY_DN30774_c0_g1_i1.p1  ORF type:complete len:293 (-),score=31.21 TRINITY_DN30774_c0_g1_i1:144-1022(-)
MGHLWHGSLTDRIVLQVQIAPNPELAEGRRQLPQSIAVEHQVTTHTHVAKGLWQVANVIAGQDQAASEAQATDRLREPCQVSRAQSPLMQRPVLVEGELGAKLVLWIPKKFVFAVTVELQCSPVQLDDLFDDGVHCTAVISRRPPAFEIGQFAVRLRHHRSQPGLAACARQHAGMLARGFAQDHLDHPGTGLGEAGFLRQLQPCHTPRAIQLPVELGLELRAGNECACSLPYTALLLLNQLLVLEQCLFGEPKNCHLLRIRAWLTPALGASQTALASWAGLTSTGRNALLEA